ncbi:hypothetical protein [Paracidovorax citrulli]|uniref:hypothetical protein n=1 Tax=Paracidovorax citrulli TaxID=80869 RepID=UPI001D182F29|nr:hypothetical protein [Paracidovorax citrulli]UEG45802.1 hypothetical protein LKW27_19485 [Paracidovorax citrulli]
MESAIAQLRLAWSLKDPDVTADRWIASAEWPFRAMALALEARRRVLWGRLSALGAARMQAQGEALGTVLALARRLPRGMAPTRGAGLGGAPEQGAPRLEDLAGVVGRATDLRSYGWQALSPGAMVAWALGHGAGALGTAAENPTVAWLSGGPVPVANAQGPCLVLGGVIDAVVLRALRASAEGRVDEALGIARMHSAPLQDAAEQVECAAAVLEAIDLRVQEITWLLGRLDARQARSVVPQGRGLGPGPQDTGAATAKVAGPALAGPAPELLPGERAVLEMLTTLGGALYRTATVPLLDDLGRLTRQSGETVARVRRWLLMTPEG